MKKLPLQFYEHADVVSIAKEMIGKIIVTRFNGEITSGRIVETEAYVAFTDKASHAYKAKRTARNEHMYGRAGTVYVYICYGIHQMLNIVTNEKEIPDAILIRAVEPLQGIDIMLKRTGKNKIDHTLTRGPGNVGKALGISKLHSGLHVADDEIYLADDGEFEIDANDIAKSKRIGVDYAGDDALRPYRFYLRGNKFVSGKTR
jgi:DNA-3-methyladenine glycosylase